MDTSPVRQLGRRVRGREDKRDAGKKKISEEDEGEVRLSHLVRRKSIAEDQKNSRQGINDADQNATNRVNSRKL